MIEAVLAAFAGWRVASLLVSEDGPWDAFRRLRDRAGAAQPGEPGEVGNGLLASVLSCVWCCSVWTAGGAFVVAEWVALWPVALVAAMGMAIVIHEYGNN